MRKVLIANRGEIALRAINVARRVGILSVAVYTEADQRSRHVFAADDAFCIGMSNSRETYLNIDSLIHIACATGCDAVYPGYGFLSENPDFVRACENAGLRFIGPSVEALITMGDKSAARQCALEAGVPVVGGSQRSYDTLKHARDSADSIGYPVLIKAVAGGGGKGIRIATSPECFDSEFDLVRRESEAAFGSSSVYLERYLTDVRHVEIQIFGDGCGGAIALGERDCSLQRRHQKLIEESPSPVLDASTREAMCENAVSLARNINYQGSGTVEYLFRPDNGEFFFIEMNTRIQVEHPVTEVRFDIDLVEAQMKIAMGYSLSDVFKDPYPKGHAIEFRINAEDSADNFRPSPGRIDCWSIPQMAGIRCDHAVYQGYEVPPYYDSLIAKVVIHAHTRTEVLEKARQFFCAFVCTGVSTTQVFHQWMLEQPDFVSGDYSTTWLDRHLEPKNGEMALV